MSKININSLIEALSIFRKYLVVDSHGYNYPTICKGEELIVWGVRFKDVTLEDLEKLKKLGFEPNEEDGDSYFCSYHFGSA